MHIANQGPLDHRSYGFAKLSDLFAAIDLFEVGRKKIGERNVVVVRRKKGGGCGSTGGPRGKPAA